jgi:hypothetical protein
VPPSRGDGPPDASFEIVNVAGIDTLLAQPVPSKSVLSGSSGSAAAKIFTGVPLTGFLSMLNGLLEKTQSSVPNDLITQPSASPRGTLTKPVAGTDKTKDLSGDTKAKPADQPKRVLIEAGPPPPPAAPRLPVIFQSTTLGTDMNSVALALAPGNHEPSSVQSTPSRDPLVASSENFDSTTSSGPDRAVRQPASPIAFALNLTPKSQDPLAANPGANASEIEIPKGLSQPSLVATQPASLALANSALDKTVAETSSLMGTRSNSGPAPEPSGISEASWWASNTGSSDMPNQSLQAQSRGSAQKSNSNENVGFSPTSPMPVGGPGDARRSQSPGSEPTVVRTMSQQAASKSTDLDTDDEEDTAGLLNSAESANLEPQNATETSASDSPAEAQSLSTLTSQPVETAPPEAARNTAEAPSKYATSIDATHALGHDQPGTDYSSDQEELKGDKPQSADKPDRMPAAGGDATRPAGGTASALPFDATVPSGAGDTSSESTSASQDKMPQTALQPEMEVAVRPQPSTGISLKVSNADSTTVDVQLRERAGRVEVTVRTPDSDLAKSMQSDLGDLVSRLENRGFKTETFVPAGAHYNAAIAPGGSQGTANHAPPDHSGAREGHEQPQGQNELNQRKQSRQVQFKEILATEDAQKEDK